MIARSFRVAIASAILLVAFGPSDRRQAEHAPVLAAAQTKIHAFVTHRDSRASTPSIIVWLAKADERVRFATAEDAARVTLANLRVVFVLGDRALAAVDALTIDASSVGPVVSRFKQRDAGRGIKIFRSGLAIAIRRSFDHDSASGFLASSLVGAHRPVVRITAEAAPDAFAALGRASRPSEARAPRAPTSTSAPPASRRRRA